MYADGLVVVAWTSIKHMRTCARACSTSMNAYVVDVLLRLGLPPAQRDIKISGHNTQPSILQYMATIKLLCGPGTINEGGN